MISAIQNKYLSVAVDSLGAQLMSLQNSHGLEYLWQGKEPYWKNRSPVLFPFVGRLVDNTYRYCGKEYHMGIHGFAASMEFRIAEQTESSIVFELTDNEETMQQYPFAFTFRVRYTLEEKTLKMGYEVTNRDDKAMFFGLGGHPGFNVPLEEEETFEDYILEFSHVCQPERIEFSEKVFQTGVVQPFALENNKVMRLNRDLLQNDAIVLRNAAREVTLRSTKTGRGVCMTYADMPYVGFWHQKGYDVPYLCIEPWSTLPARQDIVEEFTCKSDMIRLVPGECYKTTFEIKVI